MEFLGSFFTRLAAIIMSIVMFLGGLFSPGLDWVNGFLNNASFTVDTAETGEVLGNKVSNMNSWSPAGIPAQPSFIGADPMKFVEYIQLMQCTGGSEERDLFRNPLDRTVLDDYDFSKLITACRNVLSLGAKPYLKTGNVPLKLTADPQIGVFGVNVNPPDDYGQYYTYIAAVASELVKEFGLEEVRVWRFGVLTEFENGDWFKAKSGSPEDTFDAYCKLYDCTVAALQSVLGTDIDVGAHAMAVSEGLWDEGKFIEHCASGVNRYTGQTGSRLCFLSASYYDNNPDDIHDYTVADIIGALRSKAESVGLYGLSYGVDEGRILSSRSGAVGGDLLLRIVGQTYQASYDARMLRLLAENGIDYFSSWGYTTAPMFGGYPSVAYHVAERYADVLSGKETAAVSATNRVYLPGAEVGLLAGIDSDARSVGVMSYNFKPARSYKNAVDLTVAVKLPGNCGDTVSVTMWLIDDDANFFDEWEADRKTHGIGDDCFAWSYDDPGVESVTTLSAQWARDFYFENLRDKYIECALLTPVTTTEAVTDGQVTLTLELPPHAAVFYEIIY